MHTLPANLLRPALVLTLATYLNTPEAIRGSLLDTDVLVLWDWMVENSISFDPLPQDWHVERETWTPGFTDPSTNLQHWLVWDAYVQLVPMTSTQMLADIRTWLIDPQNEQTEQVITDAFENMRKRLSSKDSGDVLHMDLANAIRFPQQVYFFCVSACHCRYQTQPNRDTICSDLAKLRYQMLRRLDGPNQNLLPPVPPDWVT